MSYLRQYIWVLVILGMIFFSLVISLIFLLINKCISRQGKHRFLQLQSRFDSNIGRNTYQEKGALGNTPPLPPRTQFLTAEAQSYENLAEQHDYEECEDPLPGCTKVDHETEIQRPSLRYNGSKLKVKSGVLEGQSYENLAEENDYEESTDQLPDYIKVENDYEESTDQLPDYIKVENDYEESTDQLPDYIKVENDYEESTDLLPDYVKVEDETGAFPVPPPFIKPDPCVSAGESYENLAEEPEYEQSLDQQPDYVKVETEESCFPNPPVPAEDNISDEDYDDIGDENNNEDEEDYDDLG